MQEIIQEALKKGYLTIEAENQLRKLLRTKCNQEDISAFMQLQKETMEGNVKQEARELLKRTRYQSLTTEEPMALAY